jgi:hypothetical protein
LISSGGNNQANKADLMTCGAALAGVALAAGVCALSTVASLSATLSIPSSPDGTWPQISDDSGFQNDPSETAKGGATFLFQEPDGQRIAAFDSTDNPLTLNEPAVGRASASAIHEGPGDSLAIGGWPGPDAIALNGADETSDNSPETASSVAAPAQSLWTTLIFGLGNLSARGSTSR